MNFPMFLPATFLLLSASLVCCVIDSISFSKYYYDSANSKCTSQLASKEVKALPGFKSTALACSLTCKNDPVCDFFLIKGANCVIYLGAAPPGSPEPPTPNFIEAYQRGVASDLSLYKTITSAGSLVGFPVPFSSLVDGVMCGRSDQYSCPCTDTNKNAFIRTDLGSSYNIRKVVITPSFGTKASSLKSIVIYIGDTGSYQTDTFALQRNTSYVTPYTAETFNVNGQGRYVTIYRSYSVGGSICICHLQIHGFS
ncbi:uncharacterized protein LOC135211714 isoform X2 [Macrobrachium nipponense]|uniref:uncharacterized protein LOC135211714 isoform X2 n=1 Tax=Macrobrachium nipponense TaxID=159736 RepID=UPI0030C7E0CC